MGNTSQGFSQWGYGMFPGVPNAAAYMPNNGFMGPPRFPYQNVVLEEDEEKPAQFGAFNGFNAGMATLTAPMAAPSQRHNDNMSVLGGADGIDVSPMSRNSSKESVKSQDSLVGMPAQTANGTGEELDLAAMNDAARWHDTSFEDFLVLH